MPVSLAMLLLAVAVLAAVIAPYVERRREPGARVRIVDVDAGPGGGELPPAIAARSSVVPVSRVPLGPALPVIVDPGEHRTLPLPPSFEQLPGHRYAGRLALVIPPRERPFNWESEGL